ncbi:MAG TPA: ABC transporter ATP-binding protein [Ktedonobacteraceae bacterium]|nr:ABC transporter ATP-binding protein [Ktedonobacteraceae bacterium]
MLNARLEIELQSFSLNLLLKAEAGKTTVLLGESGAGKSTVLRLLAGLIHPHAGRIEMDGVLYFDSERKIVRVPQERPFGYVFQDYTLFPHLSVFENVAFGLKAQGLGGKQARQRVAQALEQVHLIGYDKQHPGQLSGGQQQRVALARALVLQPKLLLLDEPLSALDVQTKREVRQELRRIIQKTEITTILVTHQYIEALLLGQHILVLDNGRVIQEGTQRDLLARPRSAYIAELVGMNLFQGHVLHIEAGSTCTIQLKNSDNHDMEIQATLEDSQATQAPPEHGQEAYVVVDPRSVTLYTDPPASSARNVFSGEITQILHTSTSSSEGLARSDGVRVSLHVPSLPLPLIAEITEASAQRLKLSEGQLIYATFKALEARAYL